MSKDDKCTGLGNIKAIYVVDNDLTAEFMIERIKKESKELAKALNCFKLDESEGKRITKILSK